MAQNPTANKPLSPSAQTLLESHYGYIHPLNGTNLYSYNPDRTQSNPQGQNSRPPLPPEPLTNFQKFVASTTQRVLPIFGASFFRQVPSTFAPLNQGPVPSNYVLGPGDQVRINVWGQFFYIHTN